MTGLPPTADWTAAEWTGELHPDAASVSVTGIPSTTPPSTVPALVDAAAGRDPEAVAIVSGPTQLHYRELRERVDAFAAHLLAVGLRDEEIVGLYLGRGIDYVVGALAIMRAGGAFVPLDITQPQQRIRETIGTAGVRFVLAAAGSPELAAEPGLTVIDVREGSPHADRVALPEISSIGTERLGYVMFTSGSTGAPKGVMIRHGAIGYRLRWQQGFLDFGPDDAVLFKAPVGFDISVNEMFLPLAVGGRLVIAESGDEGDIARLLTLIDEQQVTFLYIVPSMLELLLDRPDFPVRAASLRYVWCGGEALTSGLQQRCRAALPGVTMMNGYGPAEATVGVTCRRFEAGTTDTSITMGRPNPAARVYLLDTELKQCPPGETGEIYLGGLPLGRGYVQDPAKTADRFIADSVSGLPGARLYRTGDLARYRFDGQLEFRGRADHQVKVHGHRIELGEIESVLQRSEDVRSAVVIQDDDGELSAFCVCPGLTDQPAETARRVRDWLADIVPGYMVPLRITIIESLPITEAGKVDRKALSALGPADAAAPGPRSAPAPEPAGLGSHDLGSHDLGSHDLGTRDLADQLAAIWAELLGVDEVPRQRNFFELGAHSVTVARAQTLLLKRLGIDVPVLTLFEHTTVEQLAVHLSGEASGTRPGRADDPGGAPGTDGLDADHFETGDLEAHDEELVAIVGMSVRLPAADDVHEFWESLLAGREAAVDLTREAFLAAGGRPETYDDPALVKRVSALEGADLFDAELFGIRPADAELLDPQQRLFLECCHEALDGSGHDPARFDGLIGVYGGSSHSQYYLEHVYPHLSGPGQPVNMLDAVPGSSPSALVTRVAYSLGLTGPAMSVQTACSTGLVAIHLARQDLLGYQCDLALAGSSSINPNPNRGYLADAAGRMSQEGRCRSFDAGADGMFPGDGVGVTVLKRLSDALADGDQIFGVIRGTAVNNDGSRTVGFGAPSVRGQVEVIRAAQAIADCTGENIGYVEAHGTGTQVGDPIELQALHEVFDGEPGQNDPCLIGSVKTNVGHLAAAAGIAGFLKTVLARHHGTVPPTLHYERPNPLFELEAARFQVATAVTPWPRQRPLGAVSAFGNGGTNAHVIVGPAPGERTEPEPETAVPGPVVLAISAHTPEALAQARARLARHLDEHPELNLADVAFSLAHKISHEWRDAICATDIADAVRQLSAAGEPRRASETGGGRARTAQLAEQWAAGADVDLRAGLGRRRKVPLPGYPYRRKSFWIYPPQQANIGEGVESESV